MQFNAIYPHSRTAVLPTFTVGQEVKIGENIIIPRNMKNLKIADVAQKSG